MTEEQIIKNCQEGNRDAFRMLVDVYAPKLKGICLRYMKDEFSAQDVLQESFIKIFKNIDKYEFKGSFEGWICKITVRSALEELRKKKNKIVYLETTNNYQEIAQEAEIEKKLNEKDILKMILLLPEHYRVIFNMYVIEGYSHQEISKMLNIGESTSRTKLTRARKKIQLLYHEMMEDDHSYEQRKKINN